MSALILIAAVVAVTPVFATLARRRMRREALAWKLRLMQLRYERMAAEIGYALLPVMSKFADAMNKAAASVGVMNAAFLRYNEKAKR